MAKKTEIIDKNTIHKNGEMIMFQWHELISKNTSFDLKNINFVSCKLLQKEQKSLIQLKNPLKLSNYLFIYLQMLLWIILFKKS